MLKHFPFILMLLFFSFLGRSNTMYAKTTPVVEKHNRSTVLFSPTNLPAPEIDCIQTNAAGDVIINWSPISDPSGDFVEYQVHSVQNGLLGVISNINTTTFTDPAVTQANEYFIATASGPGGTTLNFSQHVSNIFLDLTNPGNGTALLSWNQPVTPALPSMGDYYHIYREYPAGTWNLYDSVPFGTSFYRDTIQICSAFLNYQIVLENQPCSYTSNMEGDTFEDEISPYIPVLESVTIDSLTNEVTITWNENTQEDTYGYIIYVENNAGNIVELDQVLGITNTSYTYSPNTSQGPLTYSVAAFDSCYTNSTPATYQTSAKGDIHTTVFLNRSLDICNRTVTLNWTDYIGWTNVAYYEVYSKNDFSNTWILEGTTTNNSLVVYVQDALTYQYVVQAYSESGVQSFSNKTTIVITAPNQPAFNYLRVASVSNNEVQLKIHVDASVTIPALSIQKKIDGVFTELEQIPVTGTTISYIDTDVEVDAYSYTYRLEVVDSCSRLSLTSNEAKTILLQIENDEVERINYLNWTPYEEFEGSILGYNIYRGIDGVYNSGPIATLSNGQFSHEDNVSDLYSNGKFCYFVEAVEGINLFGFSEYSRSNDVCATIPPTIYIPNAFTPDGVNPIFKPVLTDFDGTSYDFSIFDRWGQVIYKTSNPNEGWNGRIAFSNKMANTGTYVYFVKLLNGDGVEIIKRGIVTLLK